MIRVKERQIASRAALLLPLKDDYFGEMMILVMTWEGHSDSISLPTYSARKILRPEAPVPDSMVYSRSCFSSLKSMEPVVVSSVLA
jgi:hypothetical protein